MSKKKQPPKFFVVPVLRPQLTCVGLKEAASKRLPFDQIKIPLDGEKAWTLFLKKSPSDQVEIFKAMIHRIKTEFLLRMMNRE